MTAEFRIPARVAENIARRHAALHAKPCIYGCRATARLYPAGWRCDQHSPWALAGRPSPDSLIDAARTLNASRVRMQEPEADVRAIRAQFGDNSGTTPGQPTDSITARWHAFHAANPAVMERLVELVEWHVSQGAHRLGIGALFEELRGKVETTGRHYSLDNSLRAIYVRALISDRPEFADLFELRQRRSA